MNIRENYLTLSTPAKRVFSIILTISVILGVFSVTLLDTLLNAPNLLYRVANAIPFILAAVGLVSAGLILSHKVEFGAWFFFGSIATVSLIVPFIAEGYAFPVAVLTLIVTIVIPIQIVRGRVTTFAMILGITAAGLIVTVDSFWPYKRVPALAQDVQTAQIATAILGILLLIAVIGIYRSLNVGTKLLLLTLGASVVSVIAVAGFAGAFTEATLSEKTNAGLLTAAKHTADSIDTYIGFNSDELLSQTKLPIFTKYLLRTTEHERSLLREELANTLLVLVKRDPENIGSYALLDKNGIDVWDTYSLDIGIDKSDRDYFYTPKQTGQVFISPVRFSPTSSDHGFYIGVPIFDALQDEVIGVLRIRLRSSLLDNILRESDDFAGAGSYAILLDEYNIILADSKNPDYFGHTPAKLDTSSIPLLVAQGRLLPNLSSDELTLNMNEFAAGLHNFGSTPYFESRDQVFPEAMQGAIVQLNSQPWKLAFIQPISVARAPIEQQGRIINIIALATSFVLGLTTLFVSTTITGPIARLTATADQISAGNLNARAVIQSQDELGTLAATINSMSEQLEKTLTGLELTVSERTAELEQQSSTLAQRSQELELSNERSQRRAAQLLAIASVSNAIATIQNIEELLPRITHVINEQFGFYHVGIFLMDASDKYAVLRAANSAGGQRMLARGHRLQVGAIGIVGNVAATGKARIALDTGIDAVYFDNPDLPETSSEMALPLFAANKVIGVLDVQSLEKDAFSNEDVEILTILANQVSIAIRNTQLFEETQRSNAEIRLLLQQDVREQWLKVVHAQKNPGLQYDGSKFLPLQGDAMPRTGSEPGLILLPIKVRGQTIGRLGIRLPQGSKLNQDEIDIVNAITERLAISAENARLLEDSQARATKEQKIGEITSKIGASINLRSIMQTAVEELGRMIPGSEVVINLDPGK